MKYRRRVVCGLVAVGCALGCLAGCSKASGNLEELRELAITDSEALFLHDYKIADVEFLAQHQERFESDYFWELASNSAGLAIIADEGLQYVIDSQELSLAEIQEMYEQGVQLPELYIDVESEVTDVIVDPVQRTALVRREFDWFDFGYTSEARCSFMEFTYDENNKITFFRESIYSYYPERILV